MKVRVFCASLAVLGGMLLVAPSGFADPISSATATAVAPVPDTSETIIPPTPTAPVMVEDAASPTRFGEAEPDADFRLRGSAEDDPYQAILREIVVGAAPTRERTHTAPTTADDDTALNFYTKEEVKARIEAVKTGVSALMGSDGSTEKSDEARELELERRIAMRGAYDNTRPASGSAAATGAASAGGERRARTQDEAAENLYFIELLFFIWDILTHPATITAAVLITLFRATLFIVHLAPRTQRVRRHLGKRRRSRSRNGSPEPVEALAVHEAVAANIEAEKPKRRRRRKHRRSFFDRFRSA